MNKGYIIEQMAETRWFYTFTDINGRGGNLKRGILMLY